MAKQHKCHHPTLPKTQSTDVGLNEKMDRNAGHTCEPQGRQNKAGTYALRTASHFSQEAKLFHIALITSHGHHCNAALEAFSEKALDNSIIQPFPFLAFSLSAAEGRKFIPDIWSDVATVYHALRAKIS